MSNKEGKKDKNNETKGCIHDGHRQRLLTTAFEMKMESLSDVQIMEIMLFYIFPRGDVNELAHRLLNHFGTLTQTIDANIEELKGVEGMGEASAKKLKVFAELFYQYAENKMSKKVVLNNFAEIVDCVEQSLRFRNTEHLLILALSHAHLLIRRKMVSLSRSGEVALELMDYVNFLSSTRPAAVVVAHNHPYGRAMPSKQDDESFNRLRTMTEEYGINFVDSYIVGENGIFSQREGKLVRKYYDIGDLKNKFKILSNPGSMDVAKEN